MDALTISYSVLLQSLPFGSKLKSGRPVYSITNQGRHEPAVARRATARSRGADGEVQDLAIPARPEPFPGSPAEPGLLIFSRERFF
jgi:hypothetical protein